jgi:hypothetical protein
MKLEAFSIPSGQVLDAILADSCSNQLEDGFHEYVINLHCTVWKIEAMPVKDAQHKFTGHFIIRKATNEDVDGVLLVHPGVGGH